jgi:hypothetical protein
LDCSSLKRFITHWMGYFLMASILSNIACIYVGLGGLISEWSYGFRLK